MAEQNTKNIAIVTGSTRALRIGPQVTSFVTKVVESNLPSPPEDTKYILSQVDIASFNLPVYDEKAIPAAVPAYAHFEHAHSKAWSTEILKYDAFILVTPEYNAGIPGSVKNAIDYLYNEIKGKPFLIVSYGVEGGRWASEGLKRCLETMFAHVVETRPQLSFSKEGKTEFGLSEDLRKTWSGVLGENSLKEWEVQKTDEIVKGFSELKVFLAKELNPKAVN